MGGFEPVWPVQPDPAQIQFAAENFFGQKQMHLMVSDNQTQQP